MSDWNEPLIGAYFPNYANFMYYPDPNKVSDPEPISMHVRYVESVDGGYVGVLVDFEGVISQGEDMDELKENLIDAFEVWRASIEC
jgi:predicted RNase H-like HicB family nuclease